MSVKLRDWETERKISTELWENIDRIEEKVYLLNWGRIEEELKKNWGKSL